MGSPKTKARTVKADRYKIDQEAALAKQQSEQQFQLAKQRQEASLAEQNKIVESLTGVAQTLGEQAAGKGPSLAEAQLKSASNRSLAQQLAAAAAARGGNPAAAQRQLMRQQGQAGRELGETAAIARMQESQQARQQQLQALNQAGGIVTGEVGRADVGAQTGIGNQFQYGTAPQTQNLAIAQFNAAQRQNADAANQAAQNQMTSGAIGAGATILGGFASSDEKLKTKKQDAKKQAQELLDKLSAKKFQYKKGVQGEESGKDTFGIMAQDLEKSEIGKTLVVETPQGKAVDTRKGFGAVLAAQAELNKRLKKLEKKNG